MVRSFFRRIKKGLGLRAYFDNELSSLYRSRQYEHANHFVRYGKNCYSQSDEDGLTLEIIKRIGISNGVFAEFGVGDGKENNTLILLGLNWRGFWCGGENLAFNIPNNSRLLYYKKWINKENICSLMKDGMQDLDEKTVDLISLDLDGNDLYFCENLLENGYKPKVFIVEYNAKFPPPVEFSIDYDPNHIWDDSDYQGASLQSFANLFEKFEYSLICCNAATGANAFFVQNIYSDLFPEVPKSIEDIYVDRNYSLIEKYGHKKSLKTIEIIIR
jgi:hypothetical protein